MVSTTQIEFLFSIENSEPFFEEEKGKTFEIVLVSSLPLCVRL